MNKRRFVSIFLLAIILFTSSGQVIAGEKEDETIRRDIIPIKGGVLNSPDGTLNSPDGALKVEIDKGIYYKPVILTIEVLKWELYKDRYISGSNVYEISIDNPLERYAEDKKVKLSFEYYGKEDGGIYMLENGRWTYLPSTVEDGRISTHVNPSTIGKRGNVFTVLVDTEAETFYDTRGHWARDEIKTYTRRGLINGYPDKTFKPDRHITRAEFLMLLSRVEKWKLPDDTSNNEYFKDLEKFNEYNEKQISYSHSHNYIKGYADGYFRPYNHISYREVEIIMRRVLNDPDFSWKAYAEKMIYDKRVRSSSYDSYNNNITRAEFSYILYKLNEWKY